MNGDMERRLAKFDIVNLRLRIISSIFLIPLVLGALYKGGWIYSLAVIIVVALGLGEWWRMTTAISSKHYERLLWRIVGCIYLVAGAISLVSVRMEPYGLQATTYLFFSVWAMDIGAYLVGRIVGGPKLCPSISPQKTWAGFWGGMVFIVIVGYASAMLMKAQGGFMSAPIAIIIAVSAALGFTAQLGDLFESWVKRRCGVKDSGALIPGHGGILDRIDGLIFGAILFAGVIAVYSEYLVEVKS